MTPSDSNNVQIESVSSELTADELPNELRYKEGQKDSTGDKEESSESLSELTDLCQEPRKIKIYFDTGHTLSDGSLYKARFRDQSFDNFSWSIFEDEFDITKEKPDGFPSGGNEVDWDESPELSLFKWVQENWPPNDQPWQGPASSSTDWLACDDGSTEVADFVHLTTDTEDPILSLIHVKAAGSDSSGREISVAKYEKVTGQAVKNLRNLDHETLGPNLNEAISDKIGNYVWKDGEYADREEMVEALEGLGTDYERRVVVIQPHILKSHFDSITTEDESIDAHRLKQLHTLLIGAENACNGLGAEFHVISATS